MRQRNKNEINWNIECAREKNKKKTKRVSSSIHLSGKTVSGVGECVCVPVTTLTHFKYVSVQEKKNIIEFVANVAHSLSLACSIHYFFIFIFEQNRIELCKTEIDGDEWNLMLSK